MYKTKLKHAAKWNLAQFECGLCETGIVQILSTCNRTGIMTTIINGCLDCGHEYGIRQAYQLKIYTRDDISWP